MRLDTAEDRQVITNAKRESDFTIANNAKMFEILSKKIYAFKPPAIVRELACNAYDSHFEAGKKDVPFRVVLPNAMHPYFEIEDFGIGLDDDGVRNVYASYGTSTKQGTNDLIGGMGLGSKTPFAYTDTFSITARKNGVERRYNAYIGQDGGPKVNLLREKDTEESNGVKITVPIQSQHFRDFYNSASFILSFFSTRPEINDEAFEYCFDPEIVSEIETGNLIVKSPDRNIRCPLYSGANIFVVMGGVCYPIEPSQVQSFMDHKERMFFEEFIASRYSDKKVFLRFNIGELDVTASREGISIEEGKSTADTLSRAFKSKMTKMVEDDQKEIDKMTHQMQMIRYCREKYRNGFNGDISSVITNFLTYKGQDISRYINKPIRFRYFDYRAIAFKSNYEGAKELRSYVDQEEVTKFGKVYILADFNDNEKVVGHVKYAKMLCEKYGKDEDGKKAICFSFKDPLNKANVKYIKKLFDDDCNLEFVDLDAYRKADMAAVRAANAKGTRAVSNSLGKTDETEFDARYINIYSTGMTSNSSRRFDSNNLDSNVLYCYMDMDSQEVSDGFVVNIQGNRKYVYPGSQAYSILNFIPESKIYILIKNRRNARKIEQAGFKNIQDVIEEIYDKDLAEAYTRYFTYKWCVNNEIETDSIVTRILFESGSSVLRPDLDQLKKKVEDVKQDYLNKGGDPNSDDNAAVLRSRYYIYDLFENDVDVQAIATEVEQVSHSMDSMVDDAYEWYPLLKLNNRYRLYASDEEIENYVDYVKAIDLMRNSV